MEPKYSLWQRIISDTPTFFLWLQRLGAGLVILSAELARLDTIPANVGTAIVSIGSTIVVVSQFAVKQYEPLKALPHDEN